MIDAPTEALAGRYHFLAPFRYQDDAPRWLARDERSGENVVVAFVERGRLAKLEAIQHFTNPHLAALVDVVHSPERAALPGGELPTEGALMVAEQISGPTLLTHLDAGPIQPARAVAWWLRLAKVVAEVHDRGGVLGGISPFSIVPKAEGRAIPPVLTQITAPVVGATLSPERLKGNAPDPCDDVWGLYASLYWALTGVAPFPGHTRDALLQDIAAGPPTPLSAFNLRDGVLEEIMKRGLSGGSRQRAVDIQELIKSLDAWERGLQLPPRAARGRALSSLSGIVKGGLSSSLQLGRVAFEVARLPREFGPELPSAAPNRHGAGVKRVGAASSETAPPAFESSPAVETSAERGPTEQRPKRPSVNPFAKKRSAWPVLLGVALVIGVLAAFFSLTRSREEPPLEPVTAAAESVDPAPLVSASARSSEPQNPTETLNACIKSYFADETFDTAARVDFVCEPGDHQDITTKLYELAEARADRAEKLKKAAAAGDDKLDAGFAVDTVTGDAGADRVRRPLGWYELLATGVIRKGCCPNAAPVTLPETTGWCEQLQDVVRDLADDSSRSGDLAPRVKRFDKAVDCLFANHVRRPYPEYKLANLTEENRAAFQQFLSHAAVSDAKRRTLSGR